MMTAVYGPAAGQAGKRSEMNTKVNKINSVGTL